MYEARKEKLEEKEALLIRDYANNLKKFFFRKNLMLFIALIILLLLAWHIRTVNVPELKDITTGEYTLGPDADPFLFLRYAKYISENGKLMKKDEMRYVPLGYNTASETKLLPYMIVYFHKILNFLSPVSINYSAVIFPAFIFLLTVIIFFFFILKVFENNKKRRLIALISTLFFILSPTLISRTVAGIPEKEPVGFFFMLLAFYFFLSAWSSKTFKKTLIFAVLAGVSTLFFQLVWGAWIYAFITIAVSTFLAFLFCKVGKREFLVYSIWLFLATAAPLLLSERYNLDWFITDMPSLMGLAVFAAILIDFLIFNTKIKNLSFIEKLRKKLPDKIISILFVFIFALLFFLVFFGVSFVNKFIQEAIIPTFLTDRLSITINENRKPYFNDWKEYFMPIMKGIPIFFLLFFLGSIFFFYEIIKKIKLKERIILIGSYVVFLFGVIFNRYSQESLMNGVSIISRIFYLGSFLLMIIAFCYFLYKCYKEKRIKELKNIDFSYLIFFIFFNLSLFGATGAVRLIMILAIPASVMIGFFIIHIIEKTMEKQHGEISKLFLVLLLVFMMLAGIYTIYSNYEMSMQIAKTMVPSAYTEQWQRAMEWVRENTDKNAVFSSWWDYGYWLQSIGERATILDGGNIIGYWNYFFARHVLTGETEKEALEFLYSHNVSYLLIDSSDIGKYLAYSSIGSDENYDKYSKIDFFSLSGESQGTSENKKAYVYTGKAVLDEDYLFEEEALFFPVQGGEIIALILTVNNSNFEQPKAVFVYKNKKALVPLRYLYYNGDLYDFKNGYEGTMYFMPLLIQEKRINNIGSALFLSKRIMKTLFVKLYLLGEGENFKLVHKQDAFIIEDLKAQGIDTGEFVYYNKVNGPIKIWAIDYPNNIEFKEKYLSTEYPPELIIVNPNY